MSFRGIKAKIQRFKAIFSDHWLSFVAKHSRSDTSYYRGEINKMLTCGTESGRFAVHQCLRCGKGEHKVHFIFLRSDKHKGNIRNGRCKRHGEASTGPINQAFGKSHHRYIYGLRTKEVIAMRRLLAEMNKSFKEIRELI